MKKVVLIGMVLGMVLGQGVALSVPSLINYQGRLTDSGGNPINNTLVIQFSIYEVSTGGVFRWQEKTECLSK